MSDLTFAEKRKLERLFGMGGGYVLDFSNRTFDEFIADSVNKNIYDPKYDRASGSKANRLRAFWEKEPNHIVGKLLADMFGCMTSPSTENAIAFEDCRRVADRLKNGAPVPEIESISSRFGERSFECLAKSVHQCIAQNEPEAGLDRLHTYVVKYLRTLCTKRGLVVDREKPLHSLMGEYTKAVLQSGHAVSELTERILKSGIALLDFFNRIRNSNTLAHDNPLLSYEEALLVFNQVSSVVRFIDSIEERDAGREPPVSVSSTEIPF